MIATYDLYRTSGDCYLNPDLGTPQSEARYTKLLHPAYPGSRGLQCIFVLPQLDKMVASDDLPKYGIHYRTLMAFCYIITGNLPGFLSSRDLSLCDAVFDSIPPDEMHGFDDVLTEDVYYYYIRKLNWFAAGFLNT